jgi:dTDP-4-amino-4,6-dideoxygalactose transaminase
LQAHLQQQGVNTIIYYPIPIHRQPAYAELGYKPGSLPITERLAAEVLSLPIFPELNNTQLQQILVALGVDLANISKDLPTTSLLQVA